MSIFDNLQKILTARYGKDVRQSIHDSIEEINEIALTYEGGAKEALEETKGVYNNTVELKEQAQIYSESAHESKVTAKEQADRAQTIVDSIDSVFVYQGSVTWAGFNAIDTTKIKAGYSWNISEEFTADERFVDFDPSDPQVYPKGTNVVFTEDGLWDSMTGIASGAGIIPITAEEFYEREEYYRGSKKTYWVIDEGGNIIDARAMRFQPTSTILSNTVQNAIIEVQDNANDQMAYMYRDISSNTTEIAQLNSDLTKLKTWKQLGSFTIPQSASQGETQICIDEKIKNATDVKVYIAKTNQVIDVSITNAYCQVFMYRPSTNWYMLGAVRRLADGSIIYHEWENTNYSTIGTSIYVYYR